MQGDAWSKEQQQGWKTPDTSACNWGGVVMQCEWQNQWPGIPTYWDQERRFFPIVLHLSICSLTFWDGGRGEGSDKQRWNYLRIFCILTIESFLMERPIILPRESLMEVQSNRECSTLLPLETALPENSPDVSCARSMYESSWPAADQSAVVGFGQLHFWALTLGDWSVTIGVPVLSVPLSRQTSNKRVVLPK